MSQRQFIKRIAAAAIGGFELFVKVSATVRCDESKGIGRGQSCAKATNSREERLRTSVPRFAKFVPWADFSGPILSFYETGSTSSLVTVQGAISQFLA